ncbi:MAG: hypothetical protein KGD67_03930 [Candidatus Lokiarchaeota archaeon]|nr:hypothetical protein [Candidatus Lokiarchaeota archaeon]
MKSDKKIKRSFYILLLTIFIIALIPLIKGQLADISEVSLEINTNFELIEYSLKQGHSENVSSIDILLPSNTWNIDDIILNFDEMEFGIEEKIVEENATNSLVIDKFNHGYAVQIEFSDPTIIYGIDLYGKNESTENLPIYIQIKGFDNFTNSPNTILYGSNVLNMPYSDTPSWHPQNFSNPIHLTKGDYFLIFDGSSIGNSPKSDYYWYFNNINPQNLDLYVSKYDSSSWLDGSQGAPFLHKINQKVNASFFPEEINMTAQIDGIFYEIIDGPNRGKGYLKKSNLNYKPNKNELNIEVKNNKTNSLKFHFNYSLRISNNFLANSMLNVKSNANNEWLIKPEIQRYSSNDTIKFEFPESWHNLNIFKNGNLINSDVLFDFSNNMIIFPNDTIQNGAIWEITANSPDVEFNLDVQKTEYLVGQELKFSLETPIKLGNYTFILIDPLNLEEYRTTLTIPPDNDIFSYVIPTNKIKGNYTAYLFWHNQTDAGVQSQVFSIKYPSGPGTPQDFSLSLIIGGVIIAGSVIGFSSYITVKKVESKHREKLKVILEKCSDLTNLHYVIVIDKKSGVDIYSNSFNNVKELDTTLISGFLQAIQNFGDELIEEAKDSKTVKIEYKNSIIIMTDFVNLRLIVIMKQKPSENFVYDIESLAYDIYKYFGKQIDKFTGILKPFHSMNKLVEHHLNVSFLYPLSVDLSLKTKMKFSQDEKNMYERAIDFLKENNSNYFYTLYLLPENVCTPKDFDTITRLIKKGVFRPFQKSEE